MTKLISKSCSPFALALLFGSASTGTSLVASYCEGRLFSYQLSGSLAGQQIAIVPFVGNVSTLTDFILLNPLVIFFMQLSRLQRESITVGSKVQRAFSPYHRFGLLLLSAILGLYAMKFYVEGSQFFDATLVPTKDGHSRITVTGWVVYSWTAIYISALAYSFIEQGAHVIYVLQLDENDIQYVPFHQDDSGGLRYIMEPTLSFGYAMVALLATFILFIIHDKLLYHIDSNRLIGFAIYIAIAFPLFVLPFWHLHRLMRSQRSQYVFSSLNRLVSLIRDVRELNDIESIKDYMTAVENADKYKKIGSSFPVWPIPIPLAIPPIGSIFAAALPLVQKFLVTAFPLLTTFAR